MKRIAHIVGVIVMMVLVESLLTFFLEPYTMQKEVERQLVYQAQEGRVPDIVALGDSTVGCGIKPEALEEEIDGVHFVLNAASANQPLEGSLYYLKYLKKEYPGLQRVIVGLTYDQLIDSQTNMQKKLLVLDRIHDPVLWCSYAKTFMSLEDLPLLLKSYRYRDRISNISENVSEKLQKQQEFEPQKNIGYTPNTTRLDPEKGEVGIGDLDWDENLVDEKSKMALEDMIQFCKDQNMQIVLVTMPVGDALFYQNAGISGAHEYIGRIAKENGIEYLDFNLWRDREKENVDGQMADNVHIMSELSEKLSHIVGKVMNGEKPQKYLYNTVAEARENVHGILYVEMHTTPQKDGSREMEASWICTDQIRPEIRFQIKDPNGSVLLDSGMQKSNTFVLPAELVGRKMTCEVTAYAKENRREYQKTYSIAVGPDTWK